MMLPAAIEFRTKPPMGQTILERALAAGLPFAWVTDDSVYRETWWLRQRIAEAGRG